MLKLVTDDDLGAEEPQVTEANRRTQRRLTKLGIVDPPPATLLLNPDGRVAVAAYRKVASGCDDLSFAQFRVLHALLLFVDGGNQAVAFGNCFPRVQTLLQWAGGIKTERALSHHLTALERKGWIERLQSTTKGGRFGTNGYRFRIPPGVITAADPGWEGPRQFDRLNNEGWLPGNRRHE